MKIKIHQSICGENKNKGWDLLLTTMHDRALAKTIAFQADLQDQTGDISWIPTVRGFMHTSDFFLVMKTYPDNSPDVRKGRVFSHVLIIEKNDIPLIRDISSLFNYFPQKVDKSINLKPIFFDTKEISKIIISEKLKKRFNKVIHGLCNLENYNNTIIWVGEHNFEKILSLFWELITKEDKKKLNFGINFDTDTIPLNKINLITTPVNIENKFINRGFCVVRGNDTKKLDSFLELYLAKDSYAQERIKAFQTDIQVEKLLRLDIDKISIVLETYEKLSQIDDLKKLRTLAVVIALYSPNQEKGKVLKENLIHRISELIKVGKVTDVVLLKDFKIDSFKNSQNILTNSIKNWLKNNLFVFKKMKNEDFSFLFKKLRESSVKNWWTNLFKKEINSFLASITIEKTDTILIWLVSDFQIFNQIKSKIDCSKRAEKYFTAQLPDKFIKKHFKELQKFAIIQKWLIFHAKIVWIKYPFNEAIKAQLEIDKDENHYDGLNIITNGIPPKTLIDFTISNKDERLLEKAINICQKNLLLFDNIDFKNIIWQKIWIGSINTETEITNSFYKPQQKIFSLYDLIIDEVYIDKEILNKISKTKFANLLNYPKREILWNKFSIKLQERFLKKTSSILLESLSKNPETIVPSDRILSKYISKNALSDFLFFNKENMKSVLPIFRKFNQLSENNLKDYIYNYKIKLDIVTAYQLGILVYEKKLAKVADVIFRKTFKYDNWNIALKECYSLLPILKRMAIKSLGIINNIEITEKQWWKAVEELVINLYDDGNSLKTIWKKAGGENSELLINASVKEVWHNAFSKLKKKRLENVTINTLLEEIKKDYANNKDFKIIYGIKENFVSNS